MYHCDEFYLFGAGELASSSVLEGMMDGLHAGGTKRAFVHTVFFIFQRHFWQQTERVG